MRYEVLPVGRTVPAEVAAVAPVALTVTCSPRHGPDHTVAVAAEYAALGCDVVPHVAARGIRDDRHLGDLLVAMRAAGIDEAFVIGGDQPHPVGAYASAVELLEVIAQHELRPARLGIAAYPEGHPLIAAEVLADALAAKARLADYMVTQMCFDAGQLVQWLTATRASGVALPALIGIPGVVDPRKLLEVSLRIGVGESLRFLRKQHGVLRLLTGRSRVADGLLAELRPAMASPSLGIAGLHVYTFNRLSATRAWGRAFEDEDAAQPG